MKRANKAPEGGADWMGTYGDMVTLLLCFFVLLYSISSVDQVKWENLVRSLNPDAENPSQIVTANTPSEGTNDVPGSNQTQTDSDFDEMYDNLIELIETYSSSQDIQIAAGDGYQFITFDGSVFFDGDSSVIRTEARVLLDDFCEIIGAANSSIKEMHIIGHTSQADPNRPNDIVTDRVLSSTRSAMVTAYIQEKGVVDAPKLVSTAYGQFRPIDTFDTAEGRANNRRVEILITKTGSVEQTLDEYYTQVYQGGEATTTE